MIKYRAMPREESQNQEAETVLEEAEAIVADAPQLNGEIEADEVVEEAEQLLREAAPHDYDVLVIGGGPGGYTAAIRAAQLGMHVALVEQSEVGGVCVNRGCIPAKALLESAHVVKLMRRAEEFGVITSGEFLADWRAMAARKDKIVEQQRTHIEKLLALHNVDVLHGRARFESTHTIAVESEDETRSLRAVDIVIATGSRPQRLPVPGTDAAGVLTSDELLNLEAVPRHLVVIGAGAVGIEFAYLFKVLGSRVTVLEMAEQIMPAEDEDISLEMARLLERDGIEIITRATLLHIKETQPLTVAYERLGKEYSFYADNVLMAAGRRANVEGLGLQVAGVECEDGKIRVHENRETNISGIYAIGDCIRDVGWAHQATAEGKMVAERICGRESTIDLHLIPSCYYTQPEVASVGLTLKEAKAQGIAARAGTFAFRANGRAVVMGESDGFVKIVIEENTESILGCQILGPRATDLINEALMAIKTGQTIEEMVSVIHTHPAFNEALPEAALAARRGADGEYSGRSATL